MHSIKILYKIHYSVSTFLLRFPLKHMRALKNDEMHAVEIHEHIKHAFETHSYKLSEKKNFNNIYKFAIHAIHNFDIIIFCNFCDRKQFALFTFCTKNN